MEEYTEELSFLFELAKCQTRKEALTFIRNHPDECEWQEWAFTLALCEECEDKCWLVKALVRIANLTGDRKKRVFHPLMAILDLEKQAFDLRVVGFDCPDPDSTRIPIKF